MNKLRVDLSWVLAKVHSLDTSNGKKYNKEIDKCLDQIFKLFETEITHLKQEIELTQKRGDRWQKEWDKEIDRSKLLEQKIIAMEAGEENMSNMYFSVKKERDWFKKKMEQTAEIAKTDLCYKLEQRVKELEEVIEMQKECYTCDSKDESTKFCIECYSKLEKERDRLKSQTHCLVKKNVEDIQAKDKEIEEIK